MPVDTPRADYSAIHPQWQRLRDCSRGRDAILKAGNNYVPDLPGADSEHNRGYRARGNYYNALGRTVQGMNGAIFQEPPVVTMPETFKPMLDDITLTNVSFETFAAEAGKEVFLTGRLGVLVDMPQAERTTNVDGVIIRQAEDMRPFTVAYQAEKIVNWRTTRRGGDQILTMVVLSERVEIGYSDADPFTCRMIDQYRVVKLDDAGHCVVQIWRQTADNGRYEQTADGDVPLMRRGQPLTFVPFFFLGALHTGPELEHPPLLDLADVNLGHWRNSCDYEYGLHLVALPTPWRAGAKVAEGSGPTRIGPSVVWDLDINGSAGMLEFEGAGLASIVVAMDEKKKQMAILGARLLEDAPQTQETLGAVRLRHTGETASLKTVAQALEKGFSQILSTAVWWQSTAGDAPSDVKDVNVELNKEYIVIRATPQEVQVALTALQAGEIAYDTFYALLQTGGWAREGIDAATERLAIQKDKALAPAPPIDPELSPGE